MNCNTRIPRNRTSDLIKVGRVSVVCAAVIFFAGAISAAEPNSPQSVAKKSDWSFRIGYCAESAVHLLQRTQWGVSRFVSGGLQYATSKLCDNELRVELENLNRQVSNSLLRVANALAENQKCKNGILQHIADAKKHQGSNDLLSQMDTELAKIELARWEELNRASGKALNEMGRKLIKSEILYQRVLAECLLNDFKSIFGADRSPTPTPESWPLDERLDESPDSEFDYLDF